MKKLIISLLVSLSFICIFVCPVYGENSIKPGNLVYSGNQYRVCTSAVVTVTVPGGKVQISSQAYTGPTGTSYKVHVVPQLTGLYVYNQTSISHYNLNNSFIRFEIKNRGSVVYSYSFTSYRGTCYYSNVLPFSVPISN